MQWFVNSHHYFLEERERYKSKFRDKKTNELPVVSLSFLFRQNGQPPCSSNANSNSSL